MKLSIKRMQFLLVLSAIAIYAAFAIISTKSSNLITIAAVLAVVAFIFYVLNMKKTFWIFLIIIPFLPPYFAFKLADSLPVLSAYRMLFLLFVVDQLLIKRKINQLFFSIRTNMFTPVITIYSVTVFFMGIMQFWFEDDKTALIGSISVLVEKVLLFYIVAMNFKSQMNLIGRKELLNKTIKIILGSAFVLSILGIAEYLLQYNVFTLLETSNVEGILSSTYYRAGELRVSSSFSHSLGYGLYLLIVIPLTFYKLKTSTRRKPYAVLLVLLLINLLLTQSRSTMLALVFSFAVMFFITNVKNKLLITFAVMFLVVPTILFSATPYADNIPVISSIGQNVKGLSDTLIGTDLMTEDYGNNEEPFTYREALITYAFTQEGFENFFGKGIGFIRTEPLIFHLPELNPYGPVISNSVDNYFINVKLELGWFGFLATILLVGTALKHVFKNRKKDYFYYILFIAFAGYFFELFMVDELETLTYFWILLALFSVYKQSEKLEEVD